MKRFVCVLNAGLIALALGIGAVGCGAPTTKAGGDKMGGKMEDKMGDKMGGKTDDKMTDKMGKDKMDDKK